MACKKDVIMKYNDADSGNSIYFPMAQTYSNVFNLSFGYVKTYTQDSIINIVVRAIGNTTNKDRDYNLSIADSTTLKRDVDYKFLNDKFSIKAGKVADTLKIKFMRTAAMKKDSLFLYMDLKPNDNFSNSFLKRDTLSGNNIVTKYYTRIKFRVDDIAGVPWFWDPTKNVSASAMISYLGAFGTNKFQLLISRYNLDVQVLTAAKYNPAPGTLIGWANGLKAYLDQMAAMNTPVLEADGSLMKMGPNAK